MTPAEQSADEPAAPLRLRDGTPARLRPVVSADRQLLRDMYARLSPASRRGRFLVAPSRLTEPILDHLVDHVDQVDHVALILLAPAGQPDEAPVGVGRVIRYAEEPTTADIAFTVADHWHGRGVGSALARALVERRPAGVTHLVTVVAADNPAPLAILARLGRIDQVLADGVYDVTVALADGPRDRAAAAEAGAEHGTGREEAQPEHPDLSRPGEAPGA